ncbi:hypothetical protein ML462_11270 [Gramella lutea]|uniref:Secreted protein n=1 Tax=Christiangramia lutea TaxID=1607951 RepID=A0A9X2A9W8_9FLAO|nr:hypothetical protein [Christiangramia lutea]MCH4823750.1 hypothetical protein [Christiangramia lutea]
MKLRLLLIFLMCGYFTQAQEYWDKEDFEISNRSIENSWREIGFSWQTESNFNLPDGSFLHLRPDIQKDQVDMLAVIDKTNRNKIERKIDLGSPLPQRKKEKKIFEISGDFETRDPNDNFMNPYFSSPYNQSRLNYRRYSPYRFNY